MTKSDINNIKFDLVLKEIYVDDGHTGTSLDRPSFNRMICDVKNSTINCIIVKDLSRFGRNYSEVGNFLETILPELSCRFISVLDNLDSFEQPVNDGDKM